ncbi:MAG: GNAT family N-acetyltransferase [Planctomycetaceae bacterium]|nr:GNAT family N-acetyltransferase [Planctomycetaceae bacterium]
MSSIPPRQFETKTGKTVLLRTASPDDATALLAYLREVLVSSEHLVTQADEFDVTEDHEREWIERHREAPGSLAILAESDGAVIGLLDFECGQRRRIAHRGVLGLTVHSQYQSRGVGNALLQALIDWAEANPSVDKLALSVAPANERALCLYRKFGFLEEGRRIREIKLGPGDYEDDILMYRLVDSPDD